VLAAFSCADACSARSSKVRELGLLCVDHKVLTTVCQLSLRNPGIYDSFSKFRCLRDLEAKVRPALLEKVGCQQLNLAAALTV
jgi:hypothetical protein